MHKPFTVRKAVDASSVKLWETLSTNANLNSVQITINDTENHKPFTIKLTNANIASIDLVHDAPGAAEHATQTYEEISFTYQKIEWTESAGGITATDNWAEHG